MGGYSGAPWPTQEERIANAKARYVEGEIDVTTLERRVWFILHNPKPTPPPAPRKRVRV